MRLTHRQVDVICKLLDLYREFQEPIHYSTLAEHLGVSPFTAYDMLCLLEEKGMVTSEYQLAPDKSGPGRAVRVFLPSQHALERTTSLSKEIGSADWNTYKQRLLDKLRNDELYDRELIVDVLARIPSAGKGELRYCVEVMTIINLRIQSSEGREILLKFLPELLPRAGSASRKDLSLLGGIVLSILALEDRGDIEWGAHLIEQVKAYMDIVINLDVEKCRLLGEYLKTVFTPLERSARYP